MGERGYIDQLKVRLDKAEALVISLGTANPGKRRRTAVGQERDDDVSNRTSSSNDDEGEDDDEDEDVDEQEQSSSSYP